MWCSDWLGNTLNYHLQKGQGQRLDYDVMAFFFLQRREVLYSWINITPVDYNFNKIAKMWKLLEILSLYFCCS